MNYTYILLCNNLIFYTGHTGNLKARLYQHSSGQVRYTKNFQSIKLVYYEKFETKTAAMEREKQIKGWTRQKKINLIKYGHP